MTRLRRGISTAEFAVLLPLLAILAFGAFDVAQFVETSLRLERAARAGAQRAIADPSDMAAVQAAVIAAWPALTTSDVPLPAQACSCAGAAASCGASCPGGMVTTIAITARRQLSPLLIEALNEGAGNAVVRLR